MSLWIYCPKKSTGAMTLVEALGAQRLRQFDGVQFRRGKPSPRRGDTIVCWGYNLPELDGIKILNRGYDKNKIDQAIELAAAGIPTIEIISGHSANRATRAKLIREGWLERSSHHVGGNDLLRGVEGADFYSKKIELANEYRLHSFSGRSIRAGKKRLRDGWQLAPSPEAYDPRRQLAHPWIRSYDAGWMIDYDQFESNNNMRKLAHKAVKTLGLTFGAVDIGEKADGRLVVLEVNTAPGVEGGTLAAYVRAIQRWMKEGDGNEAGGDGEGIRDESGPDLRPMQREEIRGVIPDPPVAPREQVRPNPEIFFRGARVVANPQAAGNGRPEGAGAGNQRPAADPAIRAWAAGMEARLRERRQARIAELRQAANRPNPPRRQA